MNRIFATLCLSLCAFAVALASFALLTAQSDCESLPDIPVGHCQ